jgi:hypothetical protein
MSVIFSDPFLGLSVDKIPSWSTQAQKRSNERSNYAVQCPKVLMVSLEPYIKGTLNNSPLAADGSGFANYTHTLPDHQTSQNYTMKSRGGATYGRWSC